MRRLAKVIFSPVGYRFPWNSCGKLRDPDSELVELMMSATQLPSQNNTIRERCLCASTSTSLPRL